MMISRDFRMRPQIIQGMPLGLFLRVLAREKFQVDRQCLGRLAYLMAFGVFNSIFGACEKWFDNADIQAADVKEPPLFIVGHWRSGTTHLHNLISRDPNFACPTAYQCLFPEHFIFSQAGGALFNAIAPPKRPMDNVAFSADTPHEDEFALAADSGLSPYICIWFPRTARRPYSGFDPCELDPKDLEKWKASLQLFMKKLTLSEGKRIALKSPPHFGRIRTILEIFPQAKFVHIVRDPYMVYASTHKLWRSGLAWSHLQIPTPELVDETILSWYVELFGLFERDRGLIPPGALHELKFEDLEISPMECMERMYAELGIPGFPDFKPALSAYLESIKSYEKNRHALSEADREKVAARWRSTFEKYGYPL